MNNSAMQHLIFHRGLGIMAEQLNIRRVTQVVEEA